jgi:hypothetical protein
MDTRAEWKSFLHGTQRSSARNSKCLLKKQDVARLQCSAATGGNQECLLK